MSAHERFAEDLALYALGSLAGAEKQELEQHLESCAACRRELEQVRGDAALLALSAAGPAAPARARARFLAALAADPRPRTVRRRRSFFELVPILAAAVLVLISILLWRENVQIRRRLEYARNTIEQNRMQGEQARELLALLHDPQAQHVTLTAANEKPHPYGNAVYESKRGRLVFMAGNLAPLPTGKTYQLWLIPASGNAPLPAGLFKPDARGHALVMGPALPAGVEAKAFAVTIEPEGGRDTPTMPIQMMGAGL
jgi:anti-sigma-K factor RskA